MKRSFLILSALCLPLQVHSQGYFAFNNYGDGGSPVAPVTISTAPGSFNPANGPAGAYIGSDYTASLFYLSGTVTNQTTFDSSNPIYFPTANTPFLGTTSFSTMNGAGFFVYGVVYLPTIDRVSVQVRAWYNGDGLYTSYEQALAAGQNVGESNPVSVFLAQGTAQAPYLDGLLPFAVGIPEPSTFALVGLGGLALLLFHRGN